MTSPDRYQPGGDIYNKISAGYGGTAANKVAAAAASGTPGAIAEAIGEVRNGPVLDQSTVSIFLDQIETDPFAAPLDSANKGLGNVITSAIKGLFKNPWVLLVVVVAGIGVFYYYGGGKIVKKILGK